MTDAVATPEMAIDRRTWFGHPRGLAVLFFAEMWERFSFYGMRALLVLYLTQHFLFSDDKAQGLYAAYASLVYLMPVVGGFIADRYLGARRAVLIGAVFLTLGHFAMAFEGSGSKEYFVAGDQRLPIEVDGRGEDRILFVIDGDERKRLEFSSEGAIIGGRTSPDATIIPSGQFSSVVEQEPLYVAILFGALSLIIVGVGFLKANISTIVGALYDQKDPRRDSGFTIFYMGINLGSVIATSLCGWLGIAYGWKYGFGLAGFGMLLGLVTFMWGKPLLEGRGEPPVKLQPSWQALTWIGGAIALLPMWWLVQRDEIVSAALTNLAPIIFLGVFAYTLFFHRAEVRSRMIVAIVLIVFSVLFWTLFEQAGSSLTLYASRNSELAILPGLRLTAAQTNLFNPLLIVLLAPLFAWAWQALGKFNPNVPVKFALGLIQVGLGFLILVYGASNFSRETLVDGEVRVLVPLIWLFLAYLLHTTGEICLSPVGLSMITKLSAPRLVGLMMGVWFLASALAHTLAGVIAKRTSSETVGGVVIDARAQLDTYVEVFQQIGLVGVGIGVALLVLSPLLKRGMAGVN